MRSSILVLVISTLTLAGCDSIKRRSDVPPRTSAPVKHETPSQTSPQEAPTSAPVVTAPATPPQPPPAQAPAFLNKELPKVGLILGPGGMKTYAHIGVLREFARARIPVHAVAGLEWGAVMGALYASQGQANDAEWKASKLKESDLPSEGGGILSQRYRPQSIATLSEFLDTVFGSSTIEKSKIEFACPAYWSRVDRAGWMSKGGVKEAMRACLPYPPFYTDNAGVYASPFSVDDAAAYLRTRGANLIVLVNVIAQGEILPPKMDDTGTTLLWSEIRRELMRAKSPVVHFTINVNTTGHPVTDYSGRRALMDAGQRQSTDIVNKMVSQYGF